MRNQAKGQEQEHSMRWTGYMVIVDAHANEVLQTLALLLVPERYRRAPKV